MKYIDVDLLKDEIKHLKIDIYDETNQFDLGARSCLGFLEYFIDVQQKSDKNLEEAAEKYRRASCNAAMKPNIDGSISEYGGNVKTAFIAGAQWMENQFKYCGSFPVEDPKGGYWPTDYYIKRNDLE